MKKNTALTQEYAEKMRPLIPLAQKAYGSKSQNTPAHQASRQYTELLVEFVEKNGSLIHLAKELEVSYAGLRRRVFTSSIPAMDNKTSRKKIDPETLEAAVARVREAKAAGTVKYHEQLAHEYYSNGISLSAIAKGLGVANAGPLYYGVQRHVHKTAAR
jgi:hypothetical protein